MTINRYRGGHGMRNYFLAAIILLALAGVTGATVLKLELPAEYEAEIVLHPTDEDRTEIRDFIFDELGTPVLII